jgi:DNA-directed RNA polymerase subunit E'/Rpb7
MKRNILIFTILLLTTSLITSCTTNNQKSFVDLSSVDSFFSFVHKIESGYDPTEQDWQMIFETKGYSISAKSDIRKQVISEMMLTAFSPSYLSRRDSVLNIPLDANISNQVAYLSQLTLENYLDMKQNKVFLEKQLANYDFSNLPELAKNGCRIFS